MTEREAEKRQGPRRARPGKFLTFQLGPEGYGIEVLKVQEIVGLMPITRVPRAPEHLRGVVNLRGKIIPTIDLRRRFGLAPVPDTDRTCIIIVTADAPRGPFPMGLVVDAVAEVQDFTAEQIEAAPDFATTLDTAFIQGLAVLKGGVRILLDIDRVLDTIETQAVAELSLAESQPAAVPP